MERDEILAELKSIVAEHQPANCGFMDEYAIGRSDGHEDVVDDVKRLIRKLEAAS